MRGLSIVEIYILSFQTIFPTLVYLSNGKIPPGIMPLLKYTKVVFLKISHNGYLDNGKTPRGGLTIVGGGGQNIVGIAKRRLFGKSHIMAIFAIVSPSPTPSPPGGVKWYK